MRSLWGLILALCVSPAWAATYTTTFDDPAENPLSESANWTNGPGDYDPVQKSGGLAGSADSGGGQPTAGVVSSLTPGTDQEATVVLGLFESASQVGRIGPSVRASTTAADSYSCVADDNAPGYRFYKNSQSGGAVVQTQLGVEVTSPAPANGDTIKLTATGTSTTTLECFVNGGSIGTRTDSTAPYTSGTVGFVVTDSGFNGFKITSFTGGDSSGGGGPTTQFFGRRVQP